MLKHSIIKADPITFSKYYATYYKNVWLRPSWSSLNEMLISSEDCYWVVLGNERVAGVLLSNNAIELIICLPSYTITPQLVRDVKEHLLKNSNHLEDLYAYNILAEQVSAFMDEGFAHEETRECMIRPTEKIDFALNDQYDYVVPSEQHISMYIELLKEAFDDNSPDYKDIKTHTEETMYYFEHADPELLKTSTIVYHKNTNEIAGLCLVSLWEGFPLIYDIAVKPKYRRSGLAAFMLDRAISLIEPIYPVVRLFVTTGNKSKLLYTKKEFLSGGELSTYRYHNT